MSVGETIRDGFITGLVLVAPLAVTVVVALFVYNWLVGFVRPFIQVAVGDATAATELVTVLLLLVSITLVGVVAMRGVGTSVFDRFDHLMEEIPVVSAVYSSTRQASNAIMHHQDQFERVVLVEWPREEVHTLAFVTSETPVDVRRELPEDGDETTYNVFVPMSPNPMGGFLAVVPSSRLTPTDLSVKEGLQHVVTTGMVGDDTEDLPSNADF